MSQLRNWWRAKGRSLSWYRGLLALFLLGWITVGSAVLALYSLLRTWLSGWALNSWFSGNVEDWIFGSGTLGDAQNFLLFALFGSVALGGFTAIRLAFQSGAKTKESDDLAAGRTVPVARNRMFGDNQAKQHIGSGGSSEVYLGVSGTGQRVAIKVLSGRPGQSSEAAETIRREYEVLRQLRSGGVANLTSQGLADPLPWIATEYVEGLSLSEHIKAHGPMNQLEARALLYRLAGILSELEDQSAAHRDLTPNNVILGREGPVLVDFGLSRIDLEHPVTGSHLIYGTEGYTSPEAINREPVGTPADIFALSQILNFVLTGTHPEFPQTMPLEGLDDEILKRASDADPRRRPTASELAELLRCDTTEVFEKWFEERALPQLPRKISPSTVAATAIVPVIATIGIGWLIWPTSEDPPGSRDLAEATASVSTVGVQGLAVDGGFFSSLPQPLGWHYRSLDPDSAYYWMVGTSGVADRVLEAHEFKGLTDSTNALLVAASFENAPYEDLDEAFPAQWNEENPFYRITAERMDEIDASPGTECSLARPSDLLIRGTWRFVVATSLNDTCEASESRWYVAGFQPGSQFWVELLARTDRPISPIDALDKLAFSQESYDIFREGDNPTSVLAASGWTNDSAGRRLRNNPSAVFTAIALIPPGSGIVMKSDRLDPTIHEATMFYEDGSTISNGQWLPFNAMSSQSDTDGYEPQQHRNYVRFHNFDLDNPAYLLLRAERATVTAGQASDLSSENAPIPSAEFYRYFSFEDEPASLQLARDSLFTMNDFQTWLETRPDILSGNLRLKNLMNTNTAGGPPVTVGLPLILNESEDRTYDDPTDSWFGPTFLRLPVGTLSVVNENEVGGDPYFEGSKQFLDNRDREHPFASLLRLYFGAAAELKFGDSNDWHMWGGNSGCEDRRVWEVSDELETLKLYVAGYVNCEVSVIGGLNTTMAPYFRLSLVRVEPSGLIQKRPVLMGDYVFADAWDPLHLSWLIEEIEEYMVIESSFAGFLAPDDASEIDLACFDWSMGFMASTGAVDAPASRAAGEEWFSAAAYTASAILKQFRQEGVEDKPQIMATAHAIVDYDLQWSKDNLDWDALASIGEEILRGCS